MYLHECNMLNDSHGYGWRAPNDTIHSNSLFLSISPHFAHPLARSSANSCVVNFRFFRCTAWIHISQVEEPVFWNVYNEFVHVTTIIVIISHAIAEYRFYFVSMSAYLLFVLILLKFIFFGSVFFFSSLLYYGDIMLNIFLFVVACADDRRHSAKWITFCWWWVLKLHAKRKIQMLFF